MTDLPFVPGTPSPEHARSPVARRAAELASQSQLLVAHFEHRALLPWPEAWCPEGHESLANPAEWQRGALAEHPFASFRHDRMTGSFHPGHRAKWTAHELVHLLVGFAHRPGASRFFHAQAAWLAELLPVAVYYFFDEAGLRRCEAHAGGGPLYGSYCPACERMALDGAREITAQDLAFARDGRTFIDAELAAFARARRTGLPHGHRHATLDLCNDGIGYAAAHALRLSSETFDRFTSQFFAPGYGLHDHLEDLEARVVAVARALVDGAEVEPWQADRAAWIRQDIAYRLLVVHSETEGEAAEEIDCMIDALAEGTDMECVAQVIASYEQLAADYHVPDARTLFALGYPLEDYGSDLEQLASGLASACPNTFAQLDPPQDWLAPFAALDLGAPERMPLGRRFARFLVEQEGGALADLARYEAALTHAAPADPWADTLDAADPEQDDLKLAEGVELLRLEYDVLDRDDLDDADVLDPPLWLAIRTHSSGELSIAELSEEVAAHLREPAPLDGATLGEAAADLVALGLLVPTRYA